MIKHMIMHPLRKKLNAQDWKRIQAVIDGEHDNATIDEMEAARDVYYDAIAGAEQTHVGITTLQ
jgi:hypothetical protein